MGKKGITFSGGEGSSIERCLLYTSDAADEN